MQDTILTLSDTLNGKVFFKPFSNFPPVLRDLCIIAENNIKQGDIINTILSVNTGKLLQKVSLYDIFEPKGEGSKKSYTYSLEYRADDRTLTNEEVNILQDKIVVELQKKLKAELRK
jgi:phenylalanyl-tRNA synthetase beta chain